MRSIWKHKWIIVPVAAAIILAIGAVGAVALAGSGNDNAAVGSSQLVTATTGVRHAGVAERAAGGRRPASGPPRRAERSGRRRRVKLQNRLRAARQRWAQARQKMTPEDQAAFDRCQQTAKGQQAALQKARQDLLGTLKQMQALGSEIPSAGQPPPLQRQRRPAQYNDEGRQRLLARSGRFAPCLRQGRERAGSDGWAGGSGAPKRRGDRG